MDGIAVKAKLLCLYKEIDYFEGKSFIDPFYFIKKWFRAVCQISEVLDIVKLL